MAPDTSPTAAAPASAPLRRAGQYLIYLFFRAFEFLLGLLSLRGCAAIGKTLGLTAHAFFPSYRRLAQDNLRIAFGREQEEAWIRRTARAHFASLGSNFICGLKLPLMKQEDIAARVTVEGMHHAEAVAAQGKPLLYAVCHLSCWELLTQVPSLFTGGKMRASIFQALGNPYLNAHVKRQREKLGYVLFDRAAGFSAPIQHMRANKGALGVLVDQHAGDKGVWCPFFDRLASTTSLPALMSLRVQTPLLPLAVYDDGPARWKLVCYPPVNSGEKKTTAEGLTAMLNIAIELVVRRAPENWFWVHNRWKTPQPDFLLSQYRRGIVYAQGYDQRRLQPFNLLVRAPNWLGDACMTLPAVRALKRGRPDLRLTILTPAKLAGLWRAMPEVDDVIEKPKETGIGEVARLVRERARYDAAILLTNSTRSTLEVSRAGIPRLVGYHGSLRARWIDQIVPEPKEKAKGPPEHQAHRYLRLASHCGAKIDDPTLFDTKPRVSGEGDSGATGNTVGCLDIPPDLVTAAAAAAATTPSQGTEKILIGLCAGAEYGQAKRWPLERFAEVARRITARLDGSVAGGAGAAPSGEGESTSGSVSTSERKTGMMGASRGVEWIIFGAPNETALGEELSRQMPAGAFNNLVGKTSLEGLIDHIRRCRLVLTNDTGTMHLAAALGVPVVAVFGSTEPILTGPLGPQHRIVRHHVACSPCFRRECPFGHYDCMTGITPQRVEREVLEALGVEEVGPDGEMEKGMVRGVLVSSEK